MADKQMSPGRWAKGPAKPSPARQVTEVYDKMRGFLKSTHWSRPYYSSLIHNNPQLPYHLLEHVNCTYLSTPSRAPTLLALKQHAQSLAVLISLLAPAQHGGTIEPAEDGKVNGDKPFAVDQAFDWLNDLQSHYRSDDVAHKKPLNALLNLVKSNSDTEGPKWHCPMEKTEIDLAEKHPFQQYRPYETHMTLLMHANEILERLDHEYSPMGGILGIIPLASENVEEQEALTNAKETLVGQWILYTQRLVVRMHELEIAYGNSLDLLANEAIVPMQHISVHGPDGRSGREIVFPQDRWILANAGEDVFSFIHQMLDRAEAHQNAQDDIFSDQKVLGDAAFSRNGDLKYRGIVKVDLNTRFYRLRNSGHGPLFVLPAFGDRPNTKHTRDMENRPTVITIPQPATKATVGAWEAKHKGVDEELMTLGVQNSNLEIQIKEFQTSIERRDDEIARLHEKVKQYDDKISKPDKKLVEETIRLQETVKYYEELMKKGEDRENILKGEIENYKQANVSVQNEQLPLNTLVGKINDQQSQIRDLQKKIKERDGQINKLGLDNDTLKILTSASRNNQAPGNPQQVAELQSQLARCQEQRQELQQEVHNLKTSRGVQGKILNFPEGFKLEYGSTFEDKNIGIIACSSVFYKSLLEAERQKNEYQRRLDESIMRIHAVQAELNQCRFEVERLNIDNQEMRQRVNANEPTKIINLPYKLQHTSSFRDDNQGLIVINTDWYDFLIKTERNAGSQNARIVELQNEIKKLKAPVEVDLSSVLRMAREKLGQSKIYKDTGNKVALSTLDYYAELEAAQKNSTAIQEQLNESRNNASTLQQQLVAARTQLAQCLQGQKDLDRQLPELQRQLNECLLQRNNLEEQIRVLQIETTSAQTAATANLQMQLESALKERQEKEAELASIQMQYDQLQLNVRNLRVEVGSLRQQLNVAQQDVPADVKAKMEKLMVEKQENENELANMQLEYDQLRLKEKNLQNEAESLRQQLSSENVTGNEIKELRQQHAQLQVNEQNLLDQIRALQAQLRDPKASASAGNNDKVKALRIELNLYKNEMGTLQKLLNDLQTQHVELQRLVGDKDKDCEEEKAHLRQKLDESNQSIKVLQMKVIAEPTKLQPVLIELEAQRDAARLQRDQQRENIKQLEEQIKMLTRG